MCVIAFAWTAAGSAFAVAPTNDDFADAQTLGFYDRDAFARGTTVGATHQTAEGEPGLPGPGSVWYRILPDATAGSVAYFRLCAEKPIPTHFWSGTVSVYSGTSLESLELVAPSSRGNCAEVRAHLTSGTTHWVSVGQDGVGEGSSWTQQGLRGEFTLRVHRPATPANDDFANATMLPEQLPITQRGNNYGATSQIAAEEEGSEAAQSVWYRWTATADTAGPLRVEACAERYPPVTATDPRREGTVEIFTGESLGSLSPVRTAIPCGQSANLFHAEPDVSYYFRVTGPSRGGHGGQFDLTIGWSARESNDNLENAIPLPDGASATAGTLHLATREPGDVDPPGTGSVWYTWTPSAASAGATRLRACDLILGDSLPMSPSRIVVWTGTDFTDMTQAGGGLGCHIMTFDAVEGTRYLIGVYGSTANRAGFRLTKRSMASRASNDDFVNSLVLPSGGALRISASNWNATSEAGEPAPHGTGAYGKSVWFSYTPQTTGVHSFHTCDPVTQLSSAIAVYTGETLSTLSRHASWSHRLYRQICDAWGQNLLRLQAGTTYRIAVDSTMDEYFTGDFRLHVDRMARPANDDFASAASVGTNLPASFRGNSALASGQARNGETGPSSARSVWFRWEATDNVQRAMFAEVCRSPLQEAGAFTGRVIVYKGGSLTGLEQVGYGDLSANESPSANVDPACSRVRFAADPGTEYRFRIDDGWERTSPTVWTRKGKSGPYEFRIGRIHRPPNDRFAGATRINALPFSVVGDNSLSTIEPGERWPHVEGTSGGRSDWYRFTPTKATRLAVDTCHPETRFLTTVSVYSGSSLTSLKRIGGSESDPFKRCLTGDGKVSFNASSGTTYYFVVDGATGQTGTYRLTVSESSTAQPASSSKTPAEVSIEQVVKLSTRKANVRVKVGNEGRLVIKKNRYVRKSVQRIGRAGTVNVRLRLTAAGRTYLQSNPASRLPLRIQLNPDGNLRPAVAVSG